MGHFVPSWAILGPFWATWSRLEAILEQFEAFLGHLRGILSHLGASWDQELPRHLPDGFARGPGSPSWPILDFILGPTIGYFLVVFGVMFLTSFRSLFGALLG